MSPYFIPAINILSVSSTLKNPLSQKTSIKSARFSDVMTGIISLITMSTYLSLCDLYSSGIACAPRKVALTSIGLVSLILLITRSIFSSSSRLRPYPLFISTAPVPIDIISSILLIDCTNNSSSDVLWSFFAEFSIPPPLFAISEYDKPRILSIYSISRLPE